MVHTEVGGGEVGREERVLRSAEGQRSVDERARRSWWWCPHGIQKYNTLRGILGKREAAVCHFHVKIPWSNTNTLHQRPCL
jgi:hypothetical protein